MSLSRLPAELVLLIARALLYCATCHCYHITPHLSALARSSRPLHALCGPYLLRNSSPLHILLWAIAHTRHDTLALALSLGANPSTAIHQLGGTGITNYVQTGTPVDIAIAMRRQSTDALSHSRKLTTIALLLATGGTVSVEGLTTPVRDGDLDLLALCLPYYPDINASRQRTTRRTLLEAAARRGHVCAVKMLLRAGAAVNSTGAPGSPGFYPPLWECWDAPFAVMQVLLEAGSDPTWRAPDGESIVQHVRRLTAAAPVTAATVDLLLRHGAIDEAPASRVNVSQGRYRGVEYTGWMPGRGVSQDWAQEWTEARSLEGCRCPVCPLSETGGVSGIRRMGG